MIRHNVRGPPRRARQIGPPGCITCTALRRGDDARTASIFVRPSVRSDRGETFFTRQPALDLGGGRGGTGCPDRLVEYSSVPRPCFRRGAHIGRRIISKLIYNFFFFFTPRIMFFVVTSNGTGCGQNTKN